MTADVDVLCVSYGSIIADIVVAPFTIVYYAYDAFSRAGWIGPTCRAHWLLTWRLSITWPRCQIIRL